MDRLRSIGRVALALGGIVAIATGEPSLARAQSGAGLPLPPGSEIVLGPVFRRDGTSVPSIATGVNANAYIFSDSADPGVPEPGARGCHPDHRALAVRALLHRRHHQAGGRLHRGFKRGARADRGTGAQRAGAAVPAGLL